MNKLLENNSLRNATYVIICIIGLGWILFWGASILLPIIFAILLSMLLSPIQKKISTKIRFPSISITLSFLSVLLPLILLFGLLSIQLMDIADSMPSIGDKVEVGIDKGIRQLRYNMPFLPVDTKNIISQNIKKGASLPLDLLQEGMVASTGVIFGLVMTFLYTFFLLYYRKSIRNYIVYNFNRSDRKDVRETISKIKLTVQKYVGGLGLVILILAVFNSVGLLIIGVKYAIFWGCLGAMLAVIPYIGTLIGGALPFFYCLATYDQSWQPVAVAVYYMAIQQIEGNLITPKIVGKQVDLNPMVALLALITLGSLWGVAGIILALPLVSILRIFLMQFEETYAVARLMGSDIAENAGVYKKIFDGKAFENENNSKSIDS